MKRLFLIIVLAALAIGAKAQAVSDMAVIPIGVTLNSIARLTVTSGGNIEFVVNTMDQYQNGVTNTSATTTTFSVASSTEFNVTLQADSPDLIPTTHTYTAATTGGNSSGGIPVEVVEYKVTVPSGLTSNVTTVTGLATEANKILSAQKAGNYEGIQILWSLATRYTEKGTLTKYPSDRYVVNAFLQLTH